MTRNYNLYSDQENNEHHEKKRRFLENDGDGETQERFNCYDDAGYTNVNQCYKFETQTSLELADEDDLAVHWLQSNNWKEIGEKKIPNYRSTYSLGKETTEKSENNFPLFSLSSLSATDKEVVESTSRIAARVFPSIIANQLQES